MASTVARLPRRADFLRVAAAGSRVATPAFVAQVAPRPEIPDGPVRVGFTASRKVGGAVERNRAKRRLRALAREAIGPHVRADLDVVLIARTAACTRDYARMRDDLRRALQRLKAERA